jgi:hypothetical protein
METPDLYSERNAIFALQHCCLFMRTWGRPEYEQLDAEERQSFEELIANRQWAGHIDALQKELMIAWPQMPNLWLDTLFNALTVERGEALSEEQFEQLGLRIDEMFRAMRRFEVVGDLRTKQADLPPRPAAEGDGPAKGKRKRSRKDDTKVKTYAAITYKAQHPDATEEQCAKAQNMPRTTLAARAEWQEWSGKIDHAAASGRLPKIKAEWDDRIGELVAVEKEETT